MADRSPSLAPTVFAGVGLDTWGGSSFVQARLALLGKTVFLLAFGFFVVINGLLLVGGGLAILPHLSTQANLMHFLAASVMGVMWLLGNARPWSMQVLGLLDAGGLVLAGIALALMSQGDPSQLMSTLCALTVTLMARAVLIPSTASRSFWLGWLAAAPTVVVSLSFPPPPPIPGLAPLVLAALTTVSAVLWLTIGVTLASVTSRTIYGLRQQVKEASEIGQYVLEEKLGSGGMGEVWKARHRMLIRPAAIKLVNARSLGSSGARDPEQRLRRFEREARATARLESPHTVRLYDFGVTDDGTLYYVMELLDGLDLDTLVQRFGPLAPERAIHLLVQVCSSLDDAHSNGLVHRDIKPANIIVSRVGSAWDFVKVLDFGLVKLGATRPGPGDVMLSDDQDVSGTPGFIAPEVVGGATQDHRIDIYSLGCVAYWLVTGKLVFEGRNAIQVMSDHLHTAPTPASARAPVPLPPELDRLILGCLAKSPDQRPASARELQASLQAILLDTPWTPERAEQWWSRYVPSSASKRPVAEVLLSQEARPPRVIRQARR